MKNKCFIILLIIVFLLSSCSFETKNELKNEIQNEFNSEANSNIAETETVENIIIPESADTIPVTRATVAKMLALAFNDKNTIQTTDIEINFDDIEPDKWYCPYINIVVLQGYMGGSDTKFFPDNPLTLEQAQLLLDKLNPNNRTKIKITDDIANKPISYALWTELYIKMLEQMKTLDSYSINVEDLIILTTPANDTDQKPWTMVTDKGTYNFTGLNIDSYIDCKIKAYTKDNELIAFVDVEETSPTITNAYLVEANQDSVKIFVGGATRAYKLQSTVIDSSVFTIPIVDIKINQGNALEIKPKTQKINGRFMKSSNGYIELAEKGDIQIDENIKVYSNLNGVIEWKSLKNIICGTDIAEFVIQDSKICAAIINKEFNPQKIRVALRTTDFKSLTHSNVILTATSDYTISSNDEVKQLKKGEIFEANPEHFANVTRLYIKPNDENAKIMIQSITRNNSTPNYRGIIEIAKQDDGYSIVNDIDLEQYLYSVVPSEMPTSYGEEAAKVQAITARSYAYNQIFANKYFTYGGNVDDSTQSQVYNNIPENELSINAVNSTKNQVLTYGNAVINANFFSTSAGITANSGEVWIDTATKRFPADTPEYLSSVKQYQNDDYGDLNNEQNANKFFKNMNIDCYDSSFSWFRWNVTMTMAELSASINANIKDRFNANKSAIKTLISPNIYRSRDIETIGDLKDIQIVKRGEGGNIMEMILIGSEATVKVYTEYNIRVLLKPTKYLENGNDIVLYRKDGTKLANYSLMPSAFFAIDKNLDSNGNINSITFYGGGNGHGVGMSQNGVKAMADKGFNCEQILNHYYINTEIKEIN